MLFPALKYFQEVHYKFCMLGNNACFKRAWACVFSTQHDRAHKLELSPNPRKTSQVAAS